MVTLVSHPAESTDFAHWEFALLYPKDKQAAKHWDGTYRDRDRDSYSATNHDSDHGQYVISTHKIAKHLAPTVPPMPTPFDNGPY